MQPYQQIEFTVLCDNIIEFNRFFEIACVALHINASDFIYKKTIPVILYAEKLKVSFTALVGFERWGDNYWSSKLNKSLFISENPDVLVELKANNKINKLFAIEFCSALPAGNQSWQRFARGKQLSKNETDYFFISELGGVELGENRREISIRYPNPIVNYAANLENKKKETGKFLNLLIKKPGCPTSLAGQFDSVIGTTLLEQYLRENINLNQSPIDYSEHQTTLIKKYISKKKKRSSFEEDFFNSNVISTKKGASTQWKKKLSIPITDDTKKILLIASSYSNAYFGTDIPFTRIEFSKIDKFIEDLNKIISKKIIISNNNKFPNIYFAAIAGFKPKGDDARPDRGLIPLVDSLSAPEDLVITLIFGPAPKSNEKDLRYNPNKIATKNGLWGSVIQNSDYVICTSKNFSRTTIIEGFRGHNRESIIPFEIRKNNIIPKTNENDVDTAIHLVCKTDCELFESMCNPPGGDWSGVSFYNKNIESETRYLTLSRAPDGKTNKRPDHIYHFYEENMILVIESKTTSSSLLKEKDVGNKMVFWTKHLLSHKPQVKKNKDGSWSEFTNEDERLEQNNFIKCGAFKYQKETKEFLQHLMDECSLDLVLVYRTIGSAWKVELITNNSCRLIPRCFEHLDRLSF